MSFELLSPEIRRYVREKGWEELRPIQFAAIQKILSTDNNYILASRTASGKTEAAFLPILTKIHTQEKGVKVLYISPLIALINDQFQRVQELCDYLGVSVTKWHGEASKAQKNRLIRQPEGVVLITPESIEAMLVNKPYNATHLFHSVEFIVIDEIHSFIGTPRGTQLKSLIARIQSFKARKACIVGLSATIGDYAEAKRFTGSEQTTTVLLDKTANPIDCVISYYEKASKTELPLELIKDLYRISTNEKVLIFPNSRGRVEEIAVKLKKISNIAGGHDNFFSHHSSVDKEVRESVETFAKLSRTEPFSIVCTSTLELGIDIGTVDVIVQVDATFSISSLIQRAGRSGRKAGKRSRIQLMTTSGWSLLQSVACWSLFQDGFIEPPSITSTPYDILAHQTLSVVKEKSGIAVGELLNQLRNNYAFEFIVDVEMAEIIKQLISSDLIESVGRELIIGIEGERVVNSRDFYTVFKSEELLLVQLAGRKIGSIPYSPQVHVGSNILLAAKIWKIVDVDFKSKKIEVVKATDGKKPTFFGNAGEVHSSIRQRMFEIALNDELPSYLDSNACAELHSFRTSYSQLHDIDKELHRLISIKEGFVVIQTFTSTRINRTLHLALSTGLGIDCILDDESSSMEIKMDAERFYSVWKNLDSILLNSNDLVAKELSEKPDLVSQIKWAFLLPEKYQAKLFEVSYYDFVSTLRFWETVKFIEIPEL